MHDWSFVDYITAIAGFVGALVMWAAQVSPKQAVSHASEWASTFGLRQQPHWLKSENADRVIRHIGAGILVSCIFIGLFEFFEIGNTDLGLKLLFGIGVALVVSAIGWSLFFPHVDFSPAHLGVVVALILMIGLGWHFATWKNRAPSQEEIDRVRAPLARELADIKQKLANTEGRQATQPSAVASPPKSYTAYEKERRLRALDEIYDVFSGRLSAAYAEGRDLFNGLKNEIARGTAPQALRDHYGRVEGAFKELDALRKRYEYFPDIVSITTMNTFNGLTEMVACDNLINEIALLQQIAPSNVGQFLDRDVVWMEARNASRDFDTFLKETMPRLKQRRQEIESAQVIVGSHQ